MNTTSLSILLGYLPVRKRDTIDMDYIAQNFKATVDIGRIMFRMPILRRQGQHRIVNEETAARLMDDVIQVACVGQYGLPGPWTDEFELWFRLHKGTTTYFVEVAAYPVERQIGCG